MNDQRKVKRPPSLLERAADMFGLDPAANAPTIDVSSLPPEAPKKAKTVKAEPVAEVLPPESVEPAFAAAPTITRTRSFSIFRNRSMRFMSAPIRPACGRCSSTCCPMP